MQREQFAAKIADWLQHHTTYRPVQSAASPHMRVCLLPGAPAVSERPRPTPCQTIRKGLPAYRPADMVRRIGGTATEASLDVTQARVGENAGRPRRELRMYDDNQRKLLRVARDIRTMLAAILFVLVVTMALLILVILGRVMR